MYRMYTLCVRTWLVCIGRSRVRSQGRVVICLTANLQRSGEWDQMDGKIAPHTPK